MVKGTSRLNRLCLPQLAHRDACGSVWVPVRRVHALATQADVWPMAALNLPLGGDRVGIVAEHDPMPAEEAAALGHPTPSASR